MKSTKNWHNRGCRPSLVSSLLFLLSFCLMASANSQEKKKREKPQAPPARVVLPDDSLRQAQDDKKPARPEPGERLQLPEVLIYGKDRARRIAGKKITISADKTELITPPAMYEPISVEELSRDERQGLARADSGKLRQLSTRFQAGNYRQLGATANWWQKSQRLDGGFDIGYQRSLGQFVNSLREDISVKARVGGASGEKGDWQAFAEFASADYGLYGAVQRETDRTNRRVQIGLSGEYIPTQSLSLDVSAETAISRMQDTLPPDSASITRTFDNTLLRISAELKKMLSPQSELFLQFRNVSDRPETRISGVSSIGQQRLRAGISINPKKWLSFLVAAEFTTRKVDTLKTSRWRPAGSLILAPSQKLIATIRFSSGFTYSPWQEWQVTNPFLSSETFSLPEEQRWHVASTLQWRLGRKLVLRAKFSRRRIDGFNYFERDSSGTFVLRQTDARLGATSIGVQISLSPSTRLEASLGTFDDAVRTGGGFMSLIDLPYRNELQIAAKLLYEPNGPFQAGVYFNWIDKRKVALGQKRTLPAYGKLDFTASYNLTRWLQVFASGENLLDEAYQVWEGYRGQGASGVAGLQARW